LAKRYSLAFCRNKVLYILLQRFLMSHADRLARARQSLEGLSIGDAFGECFFLTLDLCYKLVRAGVATTDEIADETVAHKIVALREVPRRPPWNWTDDTHMALSIVETLSDFETISQSTLARRFGLRYQESSSRGYGSSMHTLLPQLARGADWRTATRALFQGEGSYGNGAAMRVAPVGAYFADDLDAVIANARASAEVTHAHPEAIAGAIAVAVATALAWQTRDKVLSPPEFIEQVLARVPQSVVRHELEKARDLPDAVHATIDEVVEELGNGEDVTAQDTVPFVIWCASQRLENYEEALWLTVAGLGDRDTTCAMVGGIVAMSAPQSTFPAFWRESREALPSGF
jgi:ADP-ribosylglycohydrolase